MSAATSACERGSAPRPRAVYADVGGPCDEPGVVEGLPPSPAILADVGRVSSLTAVRGAASSLRPEDSTSIRPSVRSSFIARQFAAQRRDWRPRRIEHVSCANCNRTVVQVYPQAIRLQDCCCPLMHRSTLLAECDGCYGGSGPRAKSHAGR